VTDQFQHVMVLASIIIGLGLTYILVGVGSIIERLSGHGARLRLSWAHGAWLVLCLCGWYPSGGGNSGFLALLKTWTLAHYFFIIIYAVLLFLLAVILIPSDWGPTDSLDDYFLSKRRWFYPVYLIAMLADIVDGLFKGGWPYVVGSGVVVLAFWAAAIPVCLLGVWSKNIRVHSFMAIMLCSWQLIAAFEAFSKLGF
jgi:hypothetical protein